MPALLQDIMANRQTISTRKGPIEITIDGDAKAPACLLIHGGMGGIDQSALLGTAAIAPALSFRKIALSRPGYLGTPLSSGQSPEKQADLFAHLLDELQIEKTAVIAISAGGPSAIAFAARHQDRCAALILISCCTTLLPIKRAVRMRLALMNLMARAPKMVDWMRKRAEQDPIKTARRSISDPEALERLVADAEAWPLLQTLQSSLFDRMPLRLPGTMNDTKQFSKERNVPFGRIQCPTLIIHGDKDPIVPMGHALIAQQAIKNAELHTMTNAEHAALFTHLNEIRSLVGPFLKAHSPETTKT
nr:alpha/beta hydrolase [uncultured Cohaesibacter sp.]